MQKFTEKMKNNAIETNLTCWTKFLDWLRYSELMVSCLMNCT